MAGVGVEELVKIPLDYSNNLLGFQPPKGFLIKIAMKLR